MADVMYWIFAFLMSMFFGFWSAEIFGSKAEKWNTPHHLYQWWFNFIGSLTGWAVLYLLLFARFDWGKSAAVNNVGATDILLLLIAFIGISGHLPMATTGIFHGSYVWLRNLLNKHH